MFLSTCPGVRHIDLFCRESAERTFTLHFCSGLTITDVMTYIWPWPFCQHSSALYMLPDPAQYWLAKPGDPSKATSQLCILITAWRIKLAFAALRKHVPAACLSPSSTRITKHRQILSDCLALQGDLHIIGCKGVAARGLC